MQTYWTIIHLRSYLASYQLSPPFSGNSGVGGRERHGRSARLLCVMVYFFFNFPAAVGISNLQTPATIMMMEYLTKHIASSLCEATGAIRWPSNQ